MQLLTKELRKKLPKLGALSSKEAEEIPIIVKFFTPWSNWTWYAYEFDGEDVFFGFVRGVENELGTFSLKELQEMKGSFGLKIERDLYFGCEHTL